MFICCDDTLLEAAEGDSGQQLFSKNNYNIDFCMWQIYLQDTCKSCQYLQQCDVKDSEVEVSVIDS